MLAYIVVRASD